eukprot:15330174-Ditylum_brightwellii.AAC.1
MITAKTTTQAGTAITITKAAAMQAKIVTVIDTTIIVTREAKEATVVMTGKKEITIVLVTKASHTMWRKSVVALAPNLRVAATVTVTLQAAANFQATVALILVLCQTTASKVMTITMRRTPTWTWIKERYLHLATPIQPNSVGYWRWQGPNPRQKGRTSKLLALDCSTNNALSTTQRRSFLLSKDIVIASALQIALTLARLNVTKPTMIQDVNLTGTDAHVSIQANTGLARQLRPG